MGKSWNTCPRCGRSYQSITGLPCGIGDCRPSGGDPTRGQDKGRTARTTQGTPPDGGYVEQRGGCLESIGCGLVMLTAATFVAGAVKLVRIPH